MCERSVYRILKDLVKAGEIVRSDHPTKRSKLTEITLSTFSNPEINEKERLLPATEGQLIKAGGTQGPDVETKERLREMFPELCQYSSDNGTTVE